MTTAMKAARPATAMLALVAALLTGCGGGGGSEIGISSISTATAQGYAADAATMPSSAASALDEATAVLESILPSTAASSGGSGSTAGATLHAMAIVTLPSPTPLSTPCPGGGTVTWALSGATAAQQVNGQFDTGERYEMVFSACAGVNTGATLDGQLSLFVTGGGTTTWDLSLVATALKLSTAQGSFVLDGSARSQRSRLNTASGGQQTNSQFTSSALVLASSIAARQASYQLKSLNWSVARTTSASGSLLTRSHQGTLDLAVSTPLRPLATLTVATQGSVSIGSDAQTTSGGFSIATSTERLGVSYAGEVVTITLDQGNNGSIDQTWTLTRSGFLGLAG